MIARSLRLLVLAVPLALLPAACGSDGTGTTTSPLVCQKGQFRMQGMLGAETVDVDDPSSGGLTQVDTGELQVGESVDPSAAPSTQLHLTWPHGIIDGASTSASGTLIPASGAFAGQTVCLGSGTTVTIYKGNDGVGLVLGGFASGASCETPIEGTISGCWN